MFISRSTIKAINEGILICINKPNKPPTITDTRPLTILNSFRKILSLTLLERIYPDLERFISPNASGFRRGRSTGDILWAYRWMLAQSKHYKMCFETLGLDMSKAFDCINREKLLSIMEGLISPTNFQILKYLITETFLTARVQNQYGESFETSIGTPQGDALSPILFVIYLEFADREAYAHLINQHGPEPPGVIYTCVKYADDVDHNRFHIDPTKQHIAEQRNQQHLTAIKETFQPVYNIKINEDKTERVTVTPERIQAPAALKKYNIRNHTQIAPIINKKLGSKIDPHEDINHRIVMANIAFQRLSKIWRRHKLTSIRTRIRIYQTCITQVLTYNLSSLGVTEINYDKFDAFYRTKLRNILGIHHPKHITNKKLHEITNTEPVSNQIHKLRWKLFGHILRGNANTPAMQMLTRYYEMAEVHKSPPGQPAATIATVLNTDIYYGHIRSPQDVPIARLKDCNDLRTLKTIAADRRKWITLWKAILKDRKIRKEEQYQKNRNKRKARELLTIRQAPPQRTRRITYTPLIIRIRRRRRRRTDNDPMMEHPEYNLQRLRTADRDFIAAHSFSENRRL